MIRMYRIVYFVFATTLAVAVAGSGTLLAQNLDTGTGDETTVAAQESDTERLLAAQESIQRYMREHKGTVAVRMGNNAGDKLGWAVQSQNEWFYVCPWYPTVALMKSEPAVKWGELKWDDRGYLAMEKDGGLLLFKVVKGEPWLYPDRMALPPSPYSDYGKGR